MFNDFKIDYRHAWDIHSWDDGE